MVDTVRKSVVIGLMKVEEKGYSNLVLTGVLQGAGAQERNRAFAAHLFYGTLERTYTLDALLNHFLKKPILKMDAEVRNILRSALYQIKYMNSVPTSAAINEAVNLCKGMKKTSAAGLVNAVLRKSATYEIEHFKTEEERLSIHYSVHLEIAKLLLEQYKEEAEAILKTTFEKPRLAVRVNTLRTTQQELQSILSANQVHSTKGLIDNSLILENAKDITMLTAFQKGLLHVQGEASQLCAFAAMVKPGMKVVDLCSAPGGKAATLAQYMNNEGQLLCRDSSLGRLSLVKELFERLQITVAQLQDGKAEQYDKTLQNADVVLCDVPCSGLGILAKKPDIRFKSLEGIAQLYAKQQEILDTAAQYPKQGGALVYSTCTINCKENEEMVKIFLQSHENYRLVPVSLPINGAISTKFGTLLLPNRTGLDGFFIARMERLW